MAYAIKAKKNTTKLEYLPTDATEKGGRVVVLDHYETRFEKEVHEILRIIVNDEGDSYPFDDMSNVDDFRAYFLTHEAFVCRDKETDEVLGAFYVKPNFPGRCSHISNAGFIVKPSARGRGIASLMVKNYLKIAKDLGYRASFFNLVFVSNEASMKLWHKFGFREIGRIPNAGNLKGRGYTDAVQFYYDFSDDQSK